MRINALLIVSLVLAFQSAEAAADGPYKFVREILIGGEGGWDILTVDSTAHRLYLSHSTKVVVINLKKNAVMGEITDTWYAGVYHAVPEAGRGFSSNGEKRAAS
jgi:hypothetical protein